jgi:DNA-binding phage protein
MSKNAIKIKDFPTWEKVWRGVRKKIAGKRGLRAQIARDMGLQDIGVSKKLANPNAKLKSVIRLLEYAGLELVIKASGPEKIDELKQMIKKEEQNEQTTS